jgi:hypothetical protein
MMKFPATTQISFIIDGVVGYRSELIQLGGGVVRW